MNYLPISSQIASILGLVITLLLLFRVRSINKILAARNMGNSIFSLFDDIQRIPTEKKTLTKDNSQKVLQLVSYLEMFYVSKIPFRHSKIKKLLIKLKDEIENEKRTEYILRDVQMIKEQLFSIEKF